MPTVTLDTNTLPADDLRACLEPHGFEFATITVTDREVGGTDLVVFLEGLTKVPETAVWDESNWDEALWAAEEDGECLETVLSLLSGNAFPRSGQQTDLTPGQRRQLRDAMIFCAHVRSKRDLLITNDRKAFVDHGRRDLLEQRFGTRILTRKEFEAEFCGSNGAL